MIIILFTEPNKDDEGNIRTQILNIDDNEEEGNMSQKKEEKILKQNQLAIYNSRILFPS